MTKAILAGLAFLLLAGCDPNAGQQPIADNPDGGHAYFIGTVDGCRLWSVNGGAFYFANCGGAPTSTGFTHRSGKVSHYYSAVTTYGQ